MSVHANLTGADLHEPKGASSAPSGSIYVANGLGSGTWIDANTVIANSAWNTGDIKLSYTSTAPSGWVLVNDGTIGDSSSGATTRAANDTQPLFTMLWPFGQLAVSGGRGSSAAADFLSHKTLTLPLLLGRALAVAGAGAGLNVHTLFDAIGRETFALAQANLPNITPTFTGASQVWGASVGNVLSWNGTFASAVPGGSTIIGTSGGAPSVNNITTTVVPAGSISSINGNVTQTSISAIQPTAYLQLLIKL